jgi:hypothetical protein
MRIIKWWLEQKKEWLRTHWCVSEVKRNSTAVSGVDWNGQHRMTTWKVKIVMVPVIQTIDSKFRLEVLQGKRSGTVGGCERRSRRICFETEKKWRRVME